MNTSLRTRLGWIAACLPAFFSGCASSGAEGPRSLVTPQLVVASGLHEGTTLTGPLANASASNEADAALGVVQRAVWVESPVTTSGSLDAHVGLVLGSDAADPVRPYARYAGEVGFARRAEAAALIARIEDGSLGRTQAVREDARALEPDTTLRLDIRAEAADVNAPNFGLGSTRTPGSGAVRITLELGSRDGGGREMLVLSDTLAAGDGPIALVFRRNPARDEPHAFVLVVEVVDGEGLQRATAEAELRASVADAAERRRELTRQEAESREIQALVVDLGRPAERRARLVFLAGSCGAPLAHDVALIAQEADLDAFAQAVQSALNPPLDRAASGWRIERAAWLLLGRMAAEGEIAPELSGVMTRHGGEATRFPGAIEDLVRGAESVDGLAQKLAAENRILLEDASPSSRLRAYDWLASRNLAPAGFDPFGPLAERRAALAANTAAGTTAGATAKGPRTPR